MNTKFLLAALAALVLSFLGGWLIWGMLLVDFYEEHSHLDDSGLMRETPLYWAFAVGSLLTSLLLTYVLNAANRRSAGSGFVMGAIFGLLNSLGHSMFMYGETTMMDETGMVVDALAGMGFTAIIGAVIGAILGSGKKTQAAG